MCWGSNGYGQAGRAPSASPEPPTGVEGVVDALDLAVGYGHACALLADGTVRCWGSNQCGQRGDDESNADHVARTVPSVTDAVSLTAGDNLTCALLADGTARCWGSFNDYCSAGSMTPPHLVPGISNATQISAGAHHLCALSSEGEVSCLGWNEQGALGSDDFLRRTTEAAPVKGLPAAAARLRAGGNVTCAVLETHQVFCWGNNAAGQLGWGGPWLRNRPVTVEGLPPLVAPSP